MDRWTAWRVAVPAPVEGLIHHDGDRTAASPPHPESERTGELADWVWTTFQAPSTHRKR